MAVEGGRVQFKEALEFFQRKVSMPTARWDDLRHGAHVRAWSVAGMTRDDMLADLRGAMERAIAQGTGIEQFRKDFDSLVERTGWKFFGIGDTEEKRRAWRANLIYRTNMRTSYMAGRYAQMTSPAVKRFSPWWRYRHNDAVKHPRPHHLALDGMVFHCDDPIWKVWYPPNGWGCMCEVDALSDRELKRLGKTGADEKPDWMKPREGNDPRTGQIEERWPGIDRGWEYNVGEAAQAGPVPLELQTPLPALDAPARKPNLPPMPEPRPVDPARVMEPGLDPDAYVKAFLAEFGTTEDKPQFWRDRSGGIVTIDGSLFASAESARGPKLLLLADAIQEPDEIWVDWAMLPSGVTLRRSYLKRSILPDGRQFFARFQWTSKGWIGTTAFPTEEESYLEEQRQGALLYRRQDENQ